MAIMELLSGAKSGYTGGGILGRNRAPAPNNSQPGAGLLQPDPVPANPNAPPSGGGLLGPDAVPENPNAPPANPNVSPPNATDQPYGPQSRVPDYAPWRTTFTAPPVPGTTGPNAGIGGYGTPPDPDSGYFGFGGPLGGDPFSPVGLNTTTPFATPYTASEQPATPTLGGTHPGWDPRTGNEFVPYTTGPYANQNPNVNQSGYFGGGDNDPTTIATSAFTPGRR